MSPVQIVVVVRFVKVIGVGFVTVITTEPVVSSQLLFPFKSLIITRLKRLDSDIVPVKERFKEFEPTDVHGSLTGLSVSA